MQGPTSIRTGFDLGYATPNGTFINNHIMFKILVHPVTAAFLTARDRFYAAEMDIRRRQLLSDHSDRRKLLFTDGNVYYTVVGFEAQACSIRREAGWATFPVHCPDVPYATSAASNTTKVDRKLPRPQIVEEGVKIVYTYDVEWEVSAIKWVSRWDTYLRMPRGQVC